MAFAGRRVLVVGDVMMDRFIWGDVHRISPEAPVPVVKVRRESVHLGGAANVTANLAALGARPALIGLVGVDAAAGQLTEALAVAGVATRLIADPDRVTTVKTRVVARSQQVVRVDREGDGVVTGTLLSRLVDECLAALSEADAVVVSDYDKGVIGREILARMLPAARQRRVPVVVDPKISHFGFYQPVTVVTPNESEAARATATEIRSDEDCLVAARSILSRLDARGVLITRGERGMLLLERDAAPLWIAATAREVYDVTGAGDTVVAVLALALAAGAGMAEASVLANLGGGIVVGKVGTAALTVDELSQAARAGAA
jgi:D-beta-D-heptose 7-phosphate kinase/D-beta-D-heptose 1-phosphate adenosyltransferase